MPPKEILKKIIEEVIAERAAKEAEGKETPTSKNTANKVVGAKVDLTNAELLEKLAEKQEKSKADHDCQCGKCGTTFKGELDRCPNPDCNIKLNY